MPSPRRQQAQADEDRDRLKALLTNAGLAHLLEKLLHAHSSLLDASTRGAMRSAIARLGG